MLSLALHGKVPITEDVLTAAVFDLLAEHGDLALLSAILAAIDPTVAANLIAGDARFSVELWPRTPAGEPDVRITVHQASTHVATVLIEAKLGAPKSGTGEVADDGGSGDQLARYLLAESVGRPATCLLYLTHHAVPPELELEESRAHLRAKGREDLVDSIYWASWRSVERHLAHTEHQAYRRVRELLRRARMFWFDGFAIDPLPPTPARTWNYVTNPITYTWNVPTTTTAAWHYETSAASTWPTPPKLGSRNFYGGHHEQA